MAVEQISEAQKENSAAAQSTAEAAVAQKADQAQAMVDQAAADATAQANAAIDKANQALADLPGKIEETIDDFKKAIEDMLNASMPPAADPNSYDFDVDAVLGKLKGVLNPVTSAISPVEQVVGKVPVLGDLMSALTSVTSQSGPATSLSKEDLKKLVPEPPEIPPALMAKIKAVKDDLIMFSIQLPTILIDVIFQMLSSIYDMIDMIAGIIGVPPMIFPFSLIKALPPLMPKIKTLVTQMPTIVEDAIKGVVKQKMAEAQALSIPQTPSMAEVSGVAKTSVSAAEGQVASAAAGAAGNAAASAASEATLAASAAVEVQSSTTSEKPSDSSLSEATIEEPPASSPNSKLEIVNNKLNEVSAEVPQAQESPEKSTIQDVPQAIPKPPTAPPKPVRINVEFNHKLAKRA